MAVAASQLAAQGAVPSIGVEAELVHVDVVVTDRHGRTVTGLGGHDFVLQEDGKAVEIVTFTAPAPTQATAEPEASAAPQPARGRSETPAPAESALVVVYVDNPNLTMAGRHRLLPSVRSFLGAHPAIGRVLVVAASDDEARWLGPATTNPAEIAAALHTAEQGSALGQQLLSDERATLDIVKNVIENTPPQVQPPREPCEVAFPMLQEIVRQHARERERQLLRTFDRLTATVAALGALPGPKTLLYLSQGLDQRPAVHLFHQLGDICPKALYRGGSAFLAPMSELDLSTALRALAARASAARVTIYPLDGGGLSSHSIADVSYSDRRYVPSAQTDSIRETNLQAGEWIVAEGTGGVPVLRANDPARALDKLAQEIAGSYALGFTPARPPDGRAHEIRVEVRRKGLQVRHRQSYFHGSATDAVAGRSLAALLLGLEEDTLGVRVEVQQPRPGEGAKAGHVARVSISVPLAGLTRTPSPEGDRARLRVVLATRGAGSSGERAVDIRQKWIEFALSPEEPHEGASDARHEIVVAVPLTSGRSEIAVGVEDVASRRATFRKVALGAH